MSKRKRLLVTAPFMALCVLCFLSLFLMSRAHGPRAIRIALAVAGGLCYLGPMIYLQSTPIKEDESDTIAPDAINRSR